MEDGWLFSDADATPEDGDDVIILTKIAPEEHQIYIARYVSGEFQCNIGSIEQPVWTVTRAVKWRSLRCFLKDL